MGLEQTKKKSDTSTGHEGLQAQVDSTLRASLDWLERAQTEEGYWRGVVRTNSTIEAEWLLAFHMMGTRPGITDGVIRTLFNRQRDDGSWDIYPGAPEGDINSTVEAYAALRAMGYSPDQPALKRAREWILAHGGLAKVRVFTRYWLAMIGVWPWEDTPNLPPEVIRFPLWFPFNIYNFAQWARATLIPLAVVAARRPVWPLPDGSRLDELFPEGIENFDFAIPAKSSSIFSLERFFQFFDGVLHRAQEKKLIPFRENSIKLCLEWMLRHQDGDGAWGGIQPPWIYGLIALKNEGYGLDHPVVARGLNALSEHWSYERDGSTHLQATESPVWDTLFSLLAMCEAGETVAGNAVMHKGMEWMLGKQILVPGDWSLKAPDLQPGGWAFERANTKYPDLDDTALALLVLAKARHGGGDLKPAMERAIQRGVSWVLGMQCKNGGWGAFDKDNDKTLISKIPFCNFGEALDPPSVDVTAHIVEALGELGYTTENPALARALKFILDEQEAEGSWFGRWGVNHIYGVGAVLPALRALKQDMQAQHVQLAARWVVDKQNADGGWGEHCASYMDAAYRGAGESTPSQTAWALMALLSVGDASLLPSIRSGIDYLARTLTPDGSWEEELYTATGFPGYGVGERIPLDDPELHEKLQQGPELSRGFMLGYEMYSHYFPMLALARTRYWLSGE